MCVTQEALVKDLTCVCVCVCARARDAGGTSEESDGAASVKHGGGERKPQPAR
jgi:hypothetical protein